MPGKECVTRIEYVSCNWNTKAGIDRSISIETRDPGRAFAWTNLLPSCSKCNNAKGEQDHANSLLKPDDEDPFFIDDNHLLDVGELLREYALLALPMQPLCKRDCKGLCPTCGADLNAGDCDCRADEGDDRFDVLKSLLG